jgi:threonine dehydrogenase-like Zn-dependent dehydrogenase
MGQGAIDFALHGPHKPALVLVTDISPERLERTQTLYPPLEGVKCGLRLIYCNPNELPGGSQALLDFVQDITGGAMMDDAFVFYPNSALIEQADAMLGRDGCLNFFAGPQDPQFKANINFYNVHYERHHLVGTSGGNTEDMRIALQLMGEGKVNPAGMITHVGGLDSAAETTLNLPDIPGGKKLVYTHVKMPMTPIAEFRQRSETAEEPLKSIFAELAGICDENNGIWSAEAEEFLLSRSELRFEPE